MSKISDRLQNVQCVIQETCARVGRSIEELTLIVVTKSTTIEAIQEVLELGFTDLGENHVLQLKKVCSEVGSLSDNGRSVPKINWHMIGHLQRNKVKQVLPLAALIHSVDTLRLAEGLSACATRLNRTTNVLLQVNTSNEPQKYGVPVGAATHLAEQLETLPNLTLKGIMTMAPLTRNKEVVRSCFSRAKDLFDEMRGERIVGPRFHELSMGMSSDYEIAIEEGATLLRIGSAIFAG